MRFYVSKCHDYLNGENFSPEDYSTYLCLNPYYKNVTINKGRRKLMIDSGAFQDVGNDSRITPLEALDRQLNFEKTLHGKIAESIVSYDRLVDEQLDQVNGQVKKRVSEKTATDYVKETIEAAAFLSNSRKRLGKRIPILSCQGVNTEQYIKCLKEILALADTKDIIGFGGFCIISQKREYENDYYEVIKKAMPLIKDAGISRIHVFGLGLFRALLQTDIYCRLNKIEASYDTSSPELNATFGRVFNPTGPCLSNAFSKNHKINGYHPAAISKFNIIMINQFWKEFQNVPLPERFEPSYEYARNIMKAKNRINAVEGILLAATDPTQSILEI